MKAFFSVAGGAACAALLVAHAAFAEEGAAAAMVKKDGTIVMTTQDYQRDWAVLGTWAHLDQDGVKQFNVVYTQPETITTYRATGKFPEGTVLIKELRQGVTSKDGDDKVSSLGALTGWFVLIKPSQANPPQGPLWGDGWGWAKFDANAPDATVTKNYRTECIACHAPVKSTDWVHVEGYPAIRK